MRPQSNSAHDSTLEFEKRSFVRSLKNDSAAYRNLALELIFLCRFFVQAHEQCLNSSIRLRKVLIAADGALKSATETGFKTSKEVDKKFGEAIHLLSGFERDFPFKDLTSNPKVGWMVSREAKISDKSESPDPLTILHALKEDLHSKPMGNGWPRPMRVVKFHLLSSLSDAHPIVVKQVLSNSPSLQEILWNFSRFKNEKYRLTLRENPHFYSELPASPKTYGDSVEIDPTEDFRRADNLYVLTDKPELVYIMTNQVSQSFGNIWCPQNAIIFKDICGRLRGEGIVKASLNGTSCGLCEGFPVSNNPRTSTNRRELQPIITEGYPWMGWKCSIGCLHSSVDIGLRVCTEKAAPDSPLVLPLPPTSEQPGYSVAYRTHIHILNNDSLLQVFNHYRLIQEENWTLRLTWRRLAHVCRRWRCLLYDSSFHLDMCLLLKNDSPSIDTLSHLPPLPLVIDYSDETTTVARKDVDNILLGLQRHGRVRRIVLQAPSSSLRIWLELMNKHFPGLGDLSLLSTTIEETNLMLPETLQAPGLRHLALHGIGQPTGLPLLSSAISLSTLTLTRIGASCYFPPMHLVTQLQGLPHLEELSIGFAIPIPLPSSERELLPAPIPPVTMPTLRRLTFQGVDIYLNNLVAQILAPLLERLCLTLFFDLTFTLENLTEFIHRTEGFGFLVARITFNKDGASINLKHCETRDIGKFSLRVNCEPLDWQIDSATQVCHALEKVLSTAEELTLDLDADEMPSDWEDALDNMLGHELLLPFIGVKKLHVGPLLTQELSQALRSVPEELFLELLPELQELEVELEIDNAENAFSGFVETREYVGRPVALLAPNMSHAEPEVLRADPRSPLPPQSSPRRHAIYCSRELNLPLSLPPHHRLETNTDGVEPPPSRSQTRILLFHMHPLLSYTRQNHAPISYDIAFTPSAHTVIDRKMYSPIPAVTLVQPATEPPIPASSCLVLRAPKLPWVVVVGKDGEKREVKTSAALTNLDVLYAVHTTLMTRVTSEEWNLLGEGSHAQRRVAQAYKRRCTRMGGGWEDGVRRVDWLGSKTHLVGVHIGKSNEASENAGRLVFGRPHEGAKA